MNGCINISVSLGFLRSRLQNEIKCVRILLREVLVWKETARVSEKVRRATRRWGKESERPLSGSDLGGPAVSERWGKTWARTSGKVSYQRRLVSSRNPCILILQEQPTGQCGLRAHIALDFKTQHLGPLVNYLALNKRSTRHILQAAMVPNNDLKKVICATIF